MTKQPRIKRESKVKLNLTVTEKEKEMLFAVSESKNVSASELIGKWAAKEYRAMEKKKAHVNDSGAERA